MEPGPGNLRGCLHARGRRTEAREEFARARSLVEEDEFIEIFVDAPLPVTEARDPKGLYKKARRGELKNFTGVDSPYEAPERAEVRIDTTAEMPEHAVDLILTVLRQRGVVHGL